MSNDEVRANLSALAAKAAEAMCGISDDLFAAAAEPNLLNMEQVIALNIAFGTLNHAREFLLKLSAATSPPAQPETSKPN
jgi:hypothetical protein